MMCRIISQNWRSSCKIICFDLFSTALLQGAFGHVCGKKMSQVLKQNVFFYTFEN